MIHKARIAYLVVAWLFVSLAGCSPETETAVSATAPPVGATTIQTPTSEEVEPTPATQPQEAEATAAETTAECPEATEETRLLKNAKHGYCLLYPAEYKVEKPNENATILVIGGLLNAGDPRVHIAVEPANDRTIEEVANQLKADYTTPDMDIEPISITVNGEEAIMLDRLFGQDLNRRVVFVHDDLLYSLFFAPVDEVPGDPNSRFEAFYNTVLGSFTFIPQSDEVVEECLEPKAETQLLRNEEQGYCLLHSSEYQVEQPNENETVLVIGSLLNVEDPRVSIEVQDAAGRTTEQAADQIAADYPDFNIERTFGLTIGYEPAMILENVPGQVIGRIVVAVHDGRLYKLTFTPADENLGDSYTRMEELYTLVTNSFRFLPQR